MPPMQRYLTSRNSSMPYFEPSRPMPLSFMPPKGAISVEMMPSLMPTMPYSRGLGDAPDAADVAAAGEDIRGSFSGSRSQQKPGRSAQLPEKGLVNGLVEKTVRDGIPTRH